MADKAQRTEQPTIRRMQKARREGRFPVSRELVAAVQFLAFVLLLSAGGAEWFSEFAASIRQQIGRAFHAEATAAEAVRLANAMGRDVAAPVLAFGAILAAATLAAQLATTGFGLSATRVTLDFARLNPASRLRELPRQNLGSLASALLLLPLFGAAMWGVLEEAYVSFALLPASSAAQAIGSIGEAVRRLLWKAALVFLALGAIDLWRQKRRWLSDLRMSKQEIRDELKETEGNPQIKSRIRRLQRDLLRRRMMQQVPKATAVVVNPTHYAVAVLYEMETMAAPRVVAKGKNYLALRIRHKAVEHQVPIVENPPLAQALYKSAEVGQEIPPHLYRAVAEVLAYIYRLAGRNSKS